MRMLLALGLTLLTQSAFAQEPPVVAPMPELPAVSAPEEKIAVPAPSTALPTTATPAVPSQATPVLPATPSVATPTTPAVSTPSASAPATAAAQPAVKTTPKPTISLPRITLCTPDEVRGMWKLKQVYETPEGKWVEDFKTNPEQYVWFAKLRNNAYYQIKGSKKYSNMDDVKNDLFIAGGQSPQQYTVSDQGILYFYQDGKSTGMSMYCGVVQENRPPYAKGDFVFTLTQNSSAQIYLIYSKLNIGGAPAKPANNTGLGNKNAKRNNPYSPGGLFAPPSQP